MRSATTAIAAGGSTIARFTNALGPPQLQQGAGLSFSNPFYTETSFATTGFTVDAGNVGIAVSAVENSRFVAGTFRTSYGSADSMGYAINVRKSRGSVASPSAITSGDTLSTISGYGYVGATNTYLEGTRVSSVSTGTITDSTTGLGGQLRFSTAKQGTDNAPAEKLRIDDLGHIVTVAQTANTPTAGACGTGPSVSGTDNSRLVTVGTGGSATAWCLP